MNKYLLLLSVAGLSMSCAPTEVWSMGRISVMPATRHTITGAAAAVTYFVTLHVEDKFGNTSDFRYSKATAAVYSILVGTIVHFGQKLIVVTPQEEKAQANYLREKVLTIIAKVIDDCPVIAMMSLDDDNVIDWLKTAYGDHGIKTWLTAHSKIVKIQRALQKAFETLMDAKSYCKADTKHQRACDKIAKQLVAITRNITTLEAVVINEIKRYAQAAEETAALVTSLAAQEGVSQVAPEVVVS